MPARFIGIDGEMSGVAGPQTHQLIQIGIATSPTEFFVSDIGFWQPKLDVEALKVNHFTLERIRRAYREDKLPVTVDAEAKEWLGPRVVESGKNLIAVGWNVGSFDMPYLRWYLPDTAAMFSYRSLDLNAVVFAITRSAGAPYKRLKKESKWYAEEKLAKAWDGRFWHDAGYDACAALASLEFLQKRIKEGR